MDYSTVEFKRSNETQNFFFQTSILIQIEWRKFHFQKKKDRVLSRTLFFWGKRFVFLVLLEKTTTLFFWKKKRKAYFFQHSFWNEKQMTLYFFFPEIDLKDIFNWNNKKGASNIFLYWKHWQTKKMLFCHCCFSSAC